MGKKTQGSSWAPSKPPNDPNFKHSERLSCIYFSPNGPGVTAAAHKCVSGRDRDDMRKQTGKGNLGEPRAGVELTVNRFLQRT